ncbi:MAG: NUDIX domain-containing protein [Christensenellales bacterium]
MRNEQNQTLEEFLQSYDPNKYEHPSVTVDIALLTFAGDSPAVLLIKRRNHPAIGEWALPGGFVEMQEELEEAAARELLEETGIAAPLVQLGAYGAPDRDPRTRIITIAYLSLMAKGSVCACAGDDAADARLFHISLNVQAKQDILMLHAPGEKPIRIVIERRIENGLLPQAVLVEPGLASDHGLILYDAIQMAKKLPVPLAAKRLGVNEALLKDVWNRV